MKLFSHSRPELTKFSFVGIFMILGMCAAIHPVFAVNVPAPVIGIGGDDLNPDAVTAGASAYGYDDHFDVVIEDFRIGPGMTRRYDQSVYWSATLGVVNNTRGVDVDFKSIYSIGLFEGMRPDREMKSFDSEFSRLYEDDAIARRPLALRLQLDKLSAATFDPASLFIQNEGIYETQPTAAGHGMGHLSE